MYASAASGSTFPIGTTTVTVTATDAHSNTATRTFTVTVQDTTPPVINPPANIVAEATGPSGAVVAFTATATDLVDGSVAVNSSAASGSTFPIGTTTVTLTATDAHSNTATRTFTVTVQDTTPPVISPPANIVAEATGPSGAAVTFTATATDLVDGNVAVNASPASGSTFPIGTTTVTLTSTDAHSNTATRTFTVTVRDTTPPVINTPANIIAEATSAAGAVVNFTAIATDLVDGYVAVNASVAPGSTFPLGTTTVTLTAVDASGNQAVPKSFTVTVRDTTPPALTLPANIVAEATSFAGARVTFVATANDLVSGACRVTYSKQPGSEFSLGVTTVTVTAKDAVGNTATGSFTVTVRDTTPPKLTTPHDITVCTLDPKGVRVWFLAWATDTVSVPTITYSQAPGSVFPIGTTVVTVTAKDAAGNKSVGTFTVTVQPVTLRDRDDFERDHGNGGNYDNDGSYHDSSCSGDGGH